MLPKDRALFAFVRQKLYVAAVCDVLDGLGYRQQAMHHRLRPLLPDIRNCGFVGRARTVRWMETDYIEALFPRLDAHILMPY
jgi:4-hydroxy-4-methyl-2-oxoglutarate aldolase